MIFPEDAEFEVAEGDSAGGSSQSSSNSSPAQQKKLEKAIQKQREFLNDDAKKTGRLSKKDARVVETLKKLRHRVKRGKYWRAVSLFQCQFKPQLSKN